MVERHPWVYSASNPTVFFVWQFRGIETSDAGRYICTAMNSAGNTQAVAEVVVNGKFLNAFTLSTEGIT